MSGILEHGNLVRRLCPRNDLGISSSPTVDGCLPFGRSSPSDPTLGLRRRLAEPLVARTTALSRDPGSFEKTYLAIKETLSRVAPQSPVAVASANLTTDVLAVATTTNRLATQPIEVSLSFETLKVKLSLILPPQNTWSTFVTGPHPCEGFPAMNHVRRYL